MTRPLREVIAETAKNLSHKIGDFTQWEYVPSAQTFEKWLKDSPLIAALPQTEVSETVREALGDIASIARSVQSSYERNGPQYTIDGAEHYEASYVLGEMEGIEKAARQALALPVDGWRPMSEAPKDGTHILVQILSEGYGGTMQAVVYWKPDGGGKWPWKVVPDGDRWNIDCVKSWQPLPAPDRGGEDG